ncbi:uncharacterized protein SPSK_04628 [Sporothrix schenckii 1099-18]|uniref:Uncharacterized protein n=1 Tax=Sporothrix schenckii 1099-18 TaxID=1397361 RepID=A0A0F2M1B3_SPOSC|nr:uncharacterized protein SPSK_04628 [Sporothrix schenckii 1099-18]KJR83492.1 hypothetical protein SPSK_04628 [Sporothrix schenckii 1099-18]
MYLPRTHDMVCPTVGMPRKGIDQREAFTRPEQDAAAIDDSRASRSRQRMRRARETGRSWEPDTISDPRDLTRCWYSDRMRPERGEKRVAALHEARPVPPQTNEPSSNSAKQTCQAFREGAEEHKHSRDVLVTRILRPLEPSSVVSAFPRLLCIH